MSSTTFLYIVLFVLVLEGLFILNEVLSNQTNRYNVPQIVAVVTLIGFLISVVFHGGDNYFTQQKEVLLQPLLGTILSVLLWFLWSKANIKSKILQMGHLWPPLFLAHPVIPPIAQGFLFTGFLLWAVIITEYSLGTFKE